MRFTDRTQTIQEAIWQQQGEEGDLESLVCWLESRLSKENFGLDIRNMPETDLPQLVSECLEGCTRAAEVTRYLDQLAGMVEKEEKNTGETSDTH